MVVWRITPVQSRAWVCVYTSWMNFMQPFLSLLNDQPGHGRAWHVWLLTSQNCKPMWSLAKPDMTVGMYSVLILAPGMVLPWHMAQWHTWEPACNSLLPLGRLHMESGMCTLVRLVWPAKRGGVRQWKVTIPHRSIVVTTSLTCLLLLLVLYIFAIFISIVICYFESMYILS